MDRGGQVGGGAAGVAAHRLPGPPHRPADGCTLLRLEADVARELAPSREIMADGFGKKFG